jgi:hypothetical protein
MKSSWNVFALVMAMALMVMGSGCTTTGGGGEDGAKLSYNMAQSLSRGGGDIAMTALLDEGVDPKMAREYVLGLSEIIGKGDLDKTALRDAALALATKCKIKGAAEYIDALLVVIPSHVKWNEKIPEQYRTALVSFLNDGAIRALDLYKAGA